MEEELVLVKPSEQYVTELLAYKKENRELEFAECARNEAIKMRDAIRAAIKAI